MLMTKRKPATVGEILTEEFMQPLGLTQGALAEAMGVQRKHVNELCNGRRSVTSATALILARVFGNSADFWLNVQRRTDLWQAMNSPEEQARIERAKPLKRCLKACSSTRSAMTCRPSAASSSTCVWASMPRIPSRHCVVRTSLPWSRSW